MLDYAGQFALAQGLITESKTLRTKLRQAVPASRDFRNNYEFRTAKVKCRELGRPDVVQVDYSGVLDAAAVLHLASQVISDTRRAAALVARFDKVVMLFTKPIVLLPSYPSDPPPGCFIVRPDQLAVMYEYSRALASVGVLRSVFVAAQEEQLALDWVQAVAA